jgi:hypothetical protein
VLYGRLLDKNGYRYEPLTDLSHPVVLLQGGESRGNRFIECLRSDLYGVLNVSKILYRNCARSEDHNQKRSIFAVCSLHPINLFRLESHIKAVSWFDLPAFAAIAQHVAAFAGCLKSDRLCAVELRVVPVHFAERENLACEESLGLVGFL